MKIIKILFGLLAVTFVVGHCYKVWNYMHNYNRSFGDSFGIVQASAMLLGAAAAISLFKSAFKSQSDS